MSDAVFDRIYRDNVWGGAESPSGPGSGSIAFALVPEIAKLVSELGVKSVLDIGCGDGFWMPDLPGYVGIDVSEEALKLARHRHPERDYRLWAWGLLPRCELVIVRCVIQHLPLGEGVSLVKRVWDSGARWLLATTYAIDARNEDVALGDGFWVDMLAPPFSFNPPERLIRDDGASSDHGGALGLWRLP